MWSRHASLNYDYRETDDTVAAKLNVEIDLPWTDASRPTSVRWLTLEGEEHLPARLAEGRLSFTIPKLDPYGLAVIK
jgi:hypothetical protein